MSEEIKTLYIVFTESNIGVHKEIEREHYHIISGTFLPYYEEESSTWKFDGKILAKALSLEQKYKEEGAQEVFFLISYDLDENGEFMSKILRQSLLSKGVKSSMVFRTPLTERGFVAITDFISIERYEQFRTHNYYFEKRLREKGFLKTVGIMKTLVIFLLFKRAGELFYTKGEDGTSTSTFMYNKIKNKIPSLERFL